MIARIDNIVIINNIGDLNQAIQCRVYSDTGHRAISAKIRIGNYVETLQDFRKFLDIAEKECGSQITEEKEEQQYVGSFEFASSNNE